MLNIKIHHINVCLDIALPLFAHTNLAYDNINIGIFYF